MRRHRPIRIAVFAVGLLLATWAWATSNLNLSKSNINRFNGSTLMSGTATMSGPRETQTVLTVPQTGDFVLTLLCVSPVNGGIRLQAKDDGPLVHLGESCVSFQPGISLRPSTVLTCSTSGFAAAGGEYFCTVSGLLAR